MIPIIAISNLINGVIAGMLAGRIFLHHRKTHTDEHETTIGAHYFVALYSSLAAMWLLYAVPGIFVSNITTITFSQIVGNVFVYITSIIAVQIVFVSINKKFLGIIASTIILIFGLVYIFGERLYALQYIEVVSSPYVYWHPNSPPWLAIMTGVTAMFGTLIFIATFFAYGLYARGNSAVFSRAIHLAGGMTFLLSASTLYFIFSNSGGLVTTTLASLFGIIGLLVMLRGIQY